MVCGRQHLYTHTISPCSLPSSCGTCCGLQKEKSEARRREIQAQLTRLQQQMHDEHARRKSKQLEQDWKVCKGRLACLAPGGLAGVCKPAVASAECVLGRWISALQMLQQHIIPEFCCCSNMLAGMSKRCAEHSG